VSEETKFTPGPWFCHYFGTGVGGPEHTVSCATPDHITVAVIGKGLTGEFEEAEANVHLIAAAPELYEALDELDRYSQDRDYLNSPCAVKVSNVLAKARGER